MNDKDKIIEKSKKLNDRSVYAAKTNQILISVYKKLFDNLKTWADGKRYRTDFFNDYQLYLLRVLAIELCVILDSRDSSKDQYSINVLLSTVKQYLHKDRSPDGQLFDRPEEINSAPEFSGFIHIKSANIPEVLDDKNILTLLQEEKKTFLRKHASDVIKLKECRNTFLAHPDTNGIGTLPSANFFIEMSEWCFAYCNLFLNTLTASGVRLYTEEGRKSCLQKIDDNYSKFFKELVA